ncbi:MAG: SOS response-associated peptidase [Flavobacteriales bacterium]|jgi:putative SOS response-associated peptidase YedK|nr:SOS response-associated peptidase [Flavobacteriales bacterium]
MCYGVKARTEMALRIAKSRGNSGAAEKLSQLLDPFPEFDLHFGNGFDHPTLVVYTDASPRDPQLSIWGLVPAWVKDDVQRKKLWNQTLNARGETIFEKPAFRSAAAGKRCLVHVEGFYEHHHFGKRAYPYFIHLKDRPQFALAGLWEEWKDRNTGEVMHTFSIVTTKGNHLLQRIHNKPGSNSEGQPNGARMPVILTEEEEEHWLSPINCPADEETIKALIRPYPTDAMVAHPVRPLLGKEGMGNREGASDPFAYPELALADPLA